MVVRGADTSSHGDTNDNEDGDDDPNDPHFRPVPRHPFLDGLVVVRHRRGLFFAGVAHRPGAVVEAPVMVRRCAVIWGGTCATITAGLEQIDIVSFLAPSKIDPT